MFAPRGPLTAVPRSVNVPGFKMQNLGAQNPVCASLPSQGQSENRTPLFDPEIVRTRVLGGYKMPLESLLSHRSAGCLARRKPAPVAQVVKPRAYDNRSVADCVRKRRARSGISDLCKFPLVQ